MCHIPVFSKSNLIPFPHVQDQKKFNISNLVAPSFLLSYCPQLVLVAQWCPILYDPLGCSPPGSSVHGILQVRILEWVAIPFSKGPSWPRDWTHTGLRHCRPILYCLSHQGPHCTRRLMQSLGKTRAGKPLCCWDVYPWSHGHHNLPLCPGRLQGSWPQLPEPRAQRRLAFCWKGGWAS